MLLSLQNEVLVIKNICLFVRAYNSGTAKTIDFVDLFIFFSTIGFGFNVANKNFDFFDFADFLPICERSELWPEYSHRKNSCKNEMNMESTDLNLFRH